MSELDYVRSTLTSSFNQWEEAKAFLPKLEAVLRYRPLCKEDITPAMVQADPRLSIFSRIDNDEQRQLIDYLNEVGAVIDSHKNLLINASSNQELDKAVHSFITNCSLVTAKYTELICSISDDGPNLMFG